MSKRSEADNAKKKTVVRETDSASESRVGAAPALNVFYLILLVVALAGGIFVGRNTVKPSAIPQTTVNPADAGTIPLKPGPWGNLEYLPITIAAPDELLQVQNTLNTSVRWLFKDYTRDRLASLLKTFELSVPQQNQLLDPVGLEIVTNGVVLLPSRDTVLTLSPKAIEQIYRVLTLFPENDQMKEIVVASILTEMSEANGVSKTTAASFKQASWRYGKNLICYCLPHVLAAIPTYEEKSAFMKALSRQKTMLVKMRVTPDSDINALATYWSKACWSTDVKAILESLAQTPGGGQLDIIELLPPLPTSLLYTYPVPQNSLNGPAVKRDCMWTSFNFFRDPPDPKFDNSDYLLEKIKTEYYNVETDPRYGDLVMFSTPDLQFVHSAVYLADNIVYTKNGENNRNPWMLSTISDLLDIYSSNVPPEQQLKLYYFRNKYY